MYTFGKEKLYQKVVFTPRPNKLKVSKLRLQLSKVLTLPGGRLGKLIHQDNIVQNIYYIKIQTHINLNPCLDH